MMFKSHYLWVALILLFSFTFLSAAMAPGEEGASKTLDLSRHHNVGNAWLRVSNYGFFGSGSANPRWPSLEYPGGSGIDYLYQGALWFGAQKVRRDAQNREFYWKYWSEDATLPPDNQGNNDIITKTISVDGVEVPHPDWNPDLNHRLVVDTLVSIGFDGYRSIYEFLPAWNPLELLRPGYHENNRLDNIAYTSTRLHRRGYDDDGDGLIDEDPVGRAFPMRELRTIIDGEYVDLPKPFHAFAGQFIHELHDIGTQIISENERIWFPLGFQNLSYSADGRDGRQVIPVDRRFNFSDPYDDDGDFLVDEDGAPVSEQDFISYYYDYSPFDGPSNTTIRRSYGSSASSNIHMPLNVRVRQMSYQWSYDYIKNLTYVEFNITNMNPNDTLYNCVMGIYMDCDTGPQSWEGTRRSASDVSGYVTGTDMEFAYTRNKTFPDITPHWIGARVVTPDPEELTYSAWVYSLDNPGPDDYRPLNYFDIKYHPPGSKRTLNEKYWLLSGRNPNPDHYGEMVSLAKEKTTSHYEQEVAVDSRFLFAFYGDMQGFPPEGEPNSNWTENSWNLKSFDTMKIVVAIFPGEDLDSIKDTARWAKNIYKNPQQMQEVVLPDTNVHYEPPEPPPHPRMNSLLKEPSPNIINLDVYFSNRSEFFEDYIIVDEGVIGWQDLFPNFDSYVGNWDPATMPEQFAPGSVMDPNALYNPYTAYRLRHSFQGYGLWGRSGRGDLESWTKLDRWDKIDTEQDHIDYLVNNNIPGYDYKPLDGDLGIDNGLPNPINGTGVVTVEDISPGGLLHGYCLGGLDCGNPNSDNPNECAGHVYHKQSDDYFLKEIQVGDLVYGTPIFNMITARQAQGLAKHDPLVYGRALTEDEKKENHLLFKPADSKLDDETFLALVDDDLIPLRGHIGQNNIVQPPNMNRRNRNQSEEVGEEKYEARADRLARRYYHTTINNLPKGREYYVSATAWSRGIKAQGLGALESGRDANMMIFFPGPLAQTNMKNIYVVPNPYRGGASFDGSVEGDPLGDKSRRIWFVNLPAKANVQIFTLAGDLVDEFEHYPGKMHDVISISRAVQEAVGPGGIHPWDLLSKNNQIIASGLYFYSVKCHDTGNVQVGKFAVIR